MEKATVFFPSLLVYVTRCHARMMPRACGMFVRCRGFVEKIKKKLYGEKLLQSTMFSRKKLQSQILNHINI